MEPTELSKTNKRILVKIMFIAGMIIYMVMLSWLIEA